MPVPAGKGIMRTASALNAQYFVGAPVSWERFDVVLEGHDQSPGSVRSGIKRTSELCVARRSRTSHVSPTLGWPSCSLLMKSTNRLIGTFIA